MEEVKAAVSAFVVSVVKLSEEEAASLATHLVDNIGCERLEDLGLVKEVDIPMLKPIQIRKLMLAVKKTSKGKECLFFVYFPHCFPLYFR
jgi:hypothetical protein